MLKRHVVLLFTFATMVCGLDAGHSQGYPNKPVRIVTSEVGANNDVLARLIAQGISPPLGQPVIVENRPAGITSETVAHATPDGYTMLISGSALWLSSFMRDKVPYNVIRDFSPVSLLVTAPLVLVVPPALPVSSVKELIALAKSKPGELNFATGPTGTASHLAPELFKSMAGINIVRVPYKGAGPGVNAVMAGEVQLMIANAGTVTPHVKSGKLKALAVTSAQPSALVPGLPTIASGLPGYESEIITSLFVPHDTPPEIVKRLNQEIVRYLNTSAVRERILNLGVEVVASSPVELITKVKSEMARLGKVIKELGIREG